ncbi:MAG: hypothetical protein JHC39_11345 [Lentimicrobium sp.]|jgi:hypothetical protein|nr:hypothetical protein [Lentimicrobium sp.]
MKHFHFCLWLSIFSIAKVFSQEISPSVSTSQNSAKLPIWYIDLYAGGAFGYVDGFAAGGSISLQQSNVLFTIGYVSDNEQSGIEYVDNSGPISLNYYKHYRIENIPIMIGMYHPFSGSSLSASAGLSVLYYSEYIDVNTFSVFGSNATELYSKTTLGFPYEVNLKLFSKEEDASLAFGLKLFGNLGKYNYTGLALVLSIGNYK